MQELINKAFKEYSINIEEKKLIKISEFANEIIDKNKKINLISRTDIENIVDRHIIDSAIITKTSFLNNFPLTLLDIGSGGGFPGIIIAIIYDRLKITLSEQKIIKYEFLLWIKEKLNITNIEIINKRIDRAFKARYDVVTTRAAGKFEDIYPVALNILNENGSFISWTGEDSIKQSKPVADFIYNYYLKDGKKRAIGIWKKR